MNLMMSDISTSVVYTLHSLGSLTVTYIRVKETFIAVT